MKILHVISSLNPEEGGPVENVKQYCANYKLYNIEGEILCSDGPKDKWIKDKKLPKIYALGPVHFKYSFNLKLYQWLKLNIKNYDCVIINGIWQFHSIAARNICKKENIPFFLFTHGMLDPYFNKDIIKYIKKYIYWYLFENKVLRDAKRVIFTTEVEKKLAKKSFHPYKCKGISIGYGIKGIPKEIGSGSKNFLKKYNLKKNKYLLYFGRFHKKKGIDLLIKSFSNVLKYNNKLILVLAGPKNYFYENKLSKIINQNKIEKNVIVTGALYGSLKWQAIKNCFVLCLTSHSENFGIVIAEALSCSKPVFITKKVNIYKPIIKYKSGFVCEDNLKSINNKLKNIINLSKIEYNFHQVQAKKCFDENFQIKKPVLNLLEIIKRHKKINF